MSAPYALKSAEKIAYAAHLIRKASRLLDDHSSAVIAEINKIPAAEFVTTDLAKALDALAERLEQ